MENTIAFKNAESSGDEAQIAVVNCSQLVAIPQVIERGVMLIRNGRIVAVGVEREIESQITAATKVIDAGGRLVAPGFVDGHTHPVFAGNRADEFEQRSRGATYQQIREAGGGILGTVRKTRQASEDELFEAARRKMDWFLRCGTTTIEAKSGYGLSLEAELKLLRVIDRLGRSGPVRTIPTFLGAHEIPLEFKANRRAYIELIVNEMLPAVEHEQLAQYADVFCESGVFTIEESRELMLQARQHGLGIRMHVDQLSNTGGAELAAELSANTADHLEQTTVAGIAALKQAGVQPVLLPGSVYALGLKKYPDARGMLESGLDVVLATDFNPGSSPTPSLQMVMSLAVTQMKMTPWEALMGVTVHAARSLGLEEEIGSLTPGRMADFVLHDLEDWRELSYWFGLPSASAVFRSGTYMTFGTHTVI